MEGRMKEVNGRMDKGSGWRKWMKGWMEEVDERMDGGSGWKE